MLVFHPQACQASTASGLTDVDAQWAHLVA